MSSTKKQKLIDAVKRLGDERKQRFKDIGFDYKGFSELYIDYQQNLKNPLKRFDERDLKTEERNILDQLEKIKSISDKNIKIYGGRGTDLVPISSYIKTLNIRLSKIEKAKETGNYSTLGELEDEIEPGATRVGEVKERERERQEGEPGPVAPNVEVKTRQLGIPIEMLYQNMDLDELQNSTTEGEKKQYPIIRERIKKLKTLEKAREKLEEQKAIEELKKQEAKQIRDLASGNFPLETANVVKKYNNQKDSFANTEFRKLFPYDTSNPILATKLASQKYQEVHSDRIKYVPELPLNAADQTRMYNAGSQQTMDKFQKYNNPPTALRPVNLLNITPYEDAYPIGESGIRYDAIKKLIGSIF